MFDKNEFQKFATKHLGMSSMHLEKYIAATTPLISVPLRPLLLKNGPCTHKPSTFLVA